MSGWLKLKRIGFIARWIGYSSIKEALEKHLAQRWKDPFVPALMCCFTI
jgi:hypothetical protein